MLIVALLKDKLEKFKFSIFRRWWNWTESKWFL